MKPSARLMIPCLLLVVAGCGAPTPDGDLATPPAPVAQVSQVDLQVMPTAINFDDRPGPDGLRAMVFLYQVHSDGKVETVLGEGTLELVLFDGRIEESAILSTAPLHVWKFTSPELRPFSRRGMVGWGYGFPQLLWGQDAPTKSVVTLVARFTGAGRTVYSAPVAIPTRST